MRYSSRLRDLIERDDVLRCPGVHDAMSARAVDRVGVDAMYMTGYGTSVSRVGVPDAGLITMPEMVANARTIQEAVDVPVIADADTGYGNATNVVRTVREFVRSGVAGIHIEDQEFPKRCGHVAGKRVIPAAEAAGKVRAAADVRDERDEAFVLIARTDARGAVDGSLEAAIDRANAFLDAGADVAFVEGLLDAGELERTAESVDGPLLYNAAGISPDLPAARLGELGYDVVIYPTFSMAATVSAVHRHAERFVDDEVAAKADLDAAVEELPFTPHEFAGFPEVVAWEEAYLPEEELAKYEGSLGADVTGDG